MHSLNCVHYDMESAFWGCNLISNSLQLTFLLPKDIGKIPSYLHYILPPIINMNITQIMRHHTSLRDTPPPLPLPLPLPLNSGSVGV